MKKAHQSISLFLSMVIIFFLSACVCHRPTEPDDNIPEIILPIANAGPDRESAVGQYIILDGSNSKPREGHPIVFWEWDDLPSNPQPRFCSIGDEDSLIIVGFNNPGIYQFILSVRDAHLNSLPDTVQVTVTGRAQYLFEDPSLELHVRYQLQKPTEMLTQDDLLSLDSLYTSWIIVDSIISIEGIQQCANLTWIQLGFESLTDLTPLMSCTKAKYLSLTQNHTISDISPLSALRELTILELDDNIITDITSLASLTNLRFLDIGWNLGIKDIKPLSHLIHLRDLWMSHVQAEDFSPLEDLINIKNLYMSECGVMDVNIFQKMIQLHMLDLDHCHISDLSPLTDKINPKYLYLRDNNIKDISALRNMNNLYHLGLWGNQIEDILPLIENTGIGSGDYIGLDRNPLNEKSINVYIPILVSRGVDVDF